MNAFLGQVPGPGGLPRPDYGIKLRTSRIPTTVPRHWTPVQPPTLPATTARTFVTLPTARTYQAPPPIVVNPATITAPTFDTQSTKTDFVQPKEEKEPLQNYLPFVGLGLAVYRLFMRQ